MVAFNEYGNRVILFKIVALVAVHHKIVEIVFSRWNFLKYYQKLTIHTRAIENFDASTSYCSLCFIHASLFLRSLSLAITT
jgi:hypothetical protein